MGIRQKMLLPLILMGIFSAVVVLILGIFMFSDYVDDTISEEIDVFGNILEEQYSDLKNQTASVSALMANDQMLIDAIEASDRQALLTRVQTLAADDNMDFCNITDAEGKVLARSHAPEMSGDSIADQENVASALAGTPLTTVGEDPAVAMAVCSACPIYGKDGNLVGTAVIGRRLDNNGFVDEMKGLLGTEVTIFKGDTRISTTVVNSDGTRAVGTQAAQAVIDTVIGGGRNYFGKAQVVGRDAFVEYAPILSADNSVAGMLFVGKYLDIKDEIVFSFAWKSLAAAIAILAIGIVAGLIVSGRTVKPIHELVAAADQLALGDVDVDIQVETRDEMRNLALAFQKIVDANREQAQIIKTIADGDLSVSAHVRSPQDVVGHALESMLQMNNDIYHQIIGAADQVSIGAAQVSQGAQELAQNNAEQAASVEQLSRSIADIADKSRQSAEMAEKAAALGEGIRTRAEQGSEQMNRMMDAVQEINEASQNIGRVIKVIDDIAFQTNILALNAAVEAARAGQHGKGFAVVADEVRNLAGKSAEAARNTGVLIANSIEKAELGSHIAEETVCSLREIVEGITESTAMVDEIAAYSGQQTSAIDSVNLNVGQVTEVVHATSALAEETAASSEQMSSQSILLTRLVGRFRLRSNVQNNIPGQHLIQPVEASGNLETGMAYNRYS